jgi:exocyst complex component 8
MSDDRRGVSLRNKNNRRQAVTDPRQISQNGSRDGPPKGPYPPQAPQGRPSMESVRSTDSRPRPRPRPNDSTTNMVKKRYSVRYGQPGEGNQGLGIPGIPQMPPNFMQQNSSSTSLGKQQQQQAIDIRALRDPNLQPDQC